MAKPVGGILYRLQAILSCVNTCPTQGKRSRHAKTQRMTKLTAPFPVDAIPIMKDATFILDMVQYSVFFKSILMF